MPERSNTLLCARARRVVKGRVGVVGTAAEQHLRVCPGETMTEGVDSKERVIVI
jgi:hypothetical protein